MNDALRTISYFLTWGILYGFVLGVWSTTMILPFVGTAYGLFWGPLIGGICGLLVGTVAAVMQTFTFHADIDLGAYRRRASLGIGVLTAIVAPIVLIMTSRDILLATYHEYLVDSLISVLFWGPLAAAYVAHFYPVWLARLKSGTEAETSLPPVGWQVPNAIADLIRTGTHWMTVGIGACLGAVFHTRNMGGLSLSPSNIVPIVLEGAVLGAIGSMLVMVMLAIGSGALAVFVRQLFFSEDGFSVSPQTQRRLMSGIAAVFTGVSLGRYFFSYPSNPSLLLSAMALAILAVMILAGWHMYRAYPLFDQAYDKTKRKEKNAELAQSQGRLALNEDSQDQAVYEDETVLNDSDMAHHILPQAQQQKG